MRFAADQGHLSYLKHLKLVLGTRFKPQVLNQDALGVAVANGHHDVVRWLLQCPKVNVLESDGYVLCIALFRKHVHILPLLLDHAVTQEVMSPTMASHVLRGLWILCFERGWLQAVFLLCQHVDHSEQSSATSELIAHAAHYGNIELMKQIIQQQSNVGCRDKSNLLKHLCSMG